MPNRYIFSLRFSTKVLFKLFKLALILIFFMSLFRINLFMLNGFAKVEDTSVLEVFQTFLVGVRFDILIFGFIFIPVVLVLLIQALMEKWTSKLYFFYKSYLGIVWIIICVMTYMDFFFYAENGKRMRYDDYMNWSPSVLIEQMNKTPANQVWIFTIITIVLMLVAHMFIKTTDFGNWKDEYSPYPAKKGEVAFRIMLPLLIVLLMARGTVEPHHLALEHAQISNNNALNEMGLNAVWCFDK